jgi:predicted ATP-grasp superfamily ATP-dependent carboligase
VSGRLLILGASARAAAASARRAGFEPFAIDLFADADTRRICDCLKCPPEEYPHGLFRLARQAPPMQWMYTGGLENYPEQIDELAKSRELLGNYSDQIKPVRNPFVLHAVLTAHGLPTPPVLTGGGPPPAEGHWLVKRLGSSAGRGITWYDYLNFSGKVGYLQRYVAGRAMSAVYIGMFWRVYLIAASRQLIGEPWLHARPFAYCGNVGPCDLPEHVMQVLGSVGSVIAQYGPRFGLFGVDFVLDAEDRPHTIEVNPRYPASAEVLEHGFSEPLAKWHVDCATVLSVEDYESEWRAPTGFSLRSVVGKAVYYAPHRLTVPASGPWDESLAHADDVWRRPDFADIPHGGDVIDRGHPVLTILAEAATEADCLRQLQSRAADLDHLFGVRP